MVLAYPLGMPDAQKALAIVMRFAEKEAAKRAAELPTNHGAHDETNASRMYGHSAAALFDCAAAIRAELGL